MDSLPLTRVLKKGGPPISVTQVFPDDTRCVLWLSLDGTDRNEIVLKIRAEPYGVPKEGTERAY